MSDSIKSAGYGEAAAIGAGGGAVVGALASLFRDKPGLKRFLLDAATGAAGGAASSAVSGSTRGGAIYPNTQDLRRFSDRDVLGVAPLGPR